MMNENEMGYRGSKSDFITKFVKEQRVDGSLCFNQKHIRCTLMGFERNYQVKILSKQLNNIKFSTLNAQSKTMSPFFVSGFSDAESNFHVSILKNNKYKSGWRVLASFQICLHSRDLPLLLQLKAFFGGIGSIRKTTNVVIYSVNRIKDLTTIIIPHFTKYPLLTQKGADFILFKQIVELMSNKSHLYLEGLYKIINIKASMNLGLPGILF
jgi:hypothetical protein